MKRRVPPPSRDLFLGIDPGTYCGWALLDEVGNVVGSGTWSFEAKRHEGGGMRYLRARRLVRELLTGHPIVALAYEEVASHKGTAAAHVYGGIVSQITALCEELSLPYKAIPVATIKREATGKGNAGKPAMITAARERFGLDYLDPEKPKTWSDEADALWIAELLRSELVA